MIIFAAHKAGILHGMRIIIPLSEFLLEDVGRSVEDDLWINGPSADEALISVQKALLQTNL